MKKILVILFACSCLGVLGVNIGHQYRSDYMLDSDLYPEPFNKPTGGGRVHYTIPSLIPYLEARLPFTVVLTVAGSDLHIHLGMNQTLPSELNWLHCDFSFGNILWVSLHSNFDAVTKAITHIKATEKTAR